MQERLQVANNLIPEGNYTLQVIGVPEKQNDSINSRKWKFGIYSNGKVGKTFNMFLPPWEAANLIVELGGTPDKDYVVWDDEKVDGKCVNCDIKHVKYTNKNGEEKIKYSLLNITSEIPF